MSAAYPTPTSASSGAIAAHSSEPGEQQRQAETGREPRVELSRRDRAEALARMAAILLGVADVVDRVDPGGEQAERHARHGHAPRNVVVAERAGRARRRDHERVLDPLLRAASSRSRRPDDSVALQRRRRRPALAGLHVGKVSALL